MPATIGVRAMELLVSRLCHDLVGPIGAINNGVELVEEGGTDGNDDALELIGDSAQVAARRLHMFRLAFGAAGAQDGLGLADARAVLEGWFRGGKVAFTWGVANPPPMPRGLLKLVFTAAILAEEAMPQGGSLVLSAGPDGVQLAGEGKAAGFREEVRLALAGQAVEDELTPRAVIAHAAMRMAEAYAIRLAAEQPEAGRILLRVSGRA